VRVAFAMLLMVRGVWTLPVTVDGAPLRLILDTGAERTLLTEAAVTRLGMTRDPRHETRTYGFGGLSTTHDAEVISFTIGGAYLPVASVTVGQFALPPVAGPGGAVALDGLLGADVLSAFDVDLDARAGRLTLYRARDCPDAGPPWAEPAVSMGQVTLARDRLLVRVALDGVDGLATMDTGAQRSVVGERLAEAAGATQAVLDQDPIIAAHGAAAQPVPVRLHRFRTLRIGPAVIADPLLPVAPMPEGLGDGLVGDDFLAGRRLFLGYLSRRVFFTPLATPAPATAE
jgi:predicted aspartyl protease